MLGIIKHLIQNKDNHYYYHATTADNCKYGSYPRGIISKCSFVLSASNASTPARKFYRCNDASRCIINHFRSSEFFGNNSSFFGKIKLKWLSSSLNIIRTSIKFVEDEARKVICSPDKQTIFRKLLNNRVINSCNTTLLSDFHNIRNILLSKIDSYSE